MYSPCSCCCWSSVSVWLQESLLHVIAEKWRNLFIEKTMKSSAAHIISSQPELKFSIICSFYQKEAFLVQSIVEGRQLYLMISWCNLSWIWQSKKQTNIYYQPKNLTKWAGTIQTENKVSNVLVCHLEASYPGPHEVAADDGAGGAQQVHHARPGKV